MDPFFFQMMMQKREMVMGLMIAAVAGACHQLMSTDKLALIGVFSIAIGLGLILTKILFNYLPRTYISDCSDKAVFITGCDTGFGSRLAKELDSHGFQVFAGCLNVDCDGAQQLKSSCSKLLHLVQLDVTKPVQITTAVEVVQSSLGERKLWALVNNAGVACSSEIEWCPTEVYKRMMNVNALGVVHVTKSFLPLLKQSQGRVVIVSSLAGRVTVPGFTPYAMSKYAVVSFADGLRREIKKWNISVHVVEPTIYRTNISVLEPQLSRLRDYWNKCSDDVRSSYGEDYYEEFQKCLANHMNSAKPPEKIKEVIDDLVDAVAGSEPMLRYVPGLDAQLTSCSLDFMPMQMQDHIFEKYSPTTLPALVVERNSNRPKKH